MPIDQRTDMSYHAARVLLLIDAFSSERSSLDGLTKLAKLDFLLRYPSFLDQLMLRDNVKWPERLRPSTAERLSVESRMIRYKYGPWDQRYYTIVAYLVGTGLVEPVTGRGRVALRVTDRGREMAQALGSTAEWQVVAGRCRLLRQHYNFSGARLKDRIYDELPAVVNRPRHQEI